MAMITSFGPHQLAKFVVITEELKTIVDLAARDSNPHKTRSVDAPYRKRITAT